MNSRQVAEMGVARTFQNLALFKGMSVLDNIMTGRNLKMKTNLLQQAFRHAVRLRRGAKEDGSAPREVVEKIIDFLEIQPYRKTPVGQPAVRPAESASTSAARSRWSRRCCCSTSRWPA